MLKVGNMIETDENGRFYRPVKISRTLNFLLNFEIPESDEKIYLEGADGENFACSLSKQFVKAALELVPSRQFKILSNEMMRSKAAVNPGVLDLFGRAPRTFGTFPPKRNTKDELWLCRKAGAGYFPIDRREIPKSTRETNAELGQDERPVFEQREFGYVWAIRKIQELLRGSIPSYLDVSKSF